eukprot:jgi/Chrzof1/6465/Cz18g12030.t1
MTPYEQNGDANETGEPDAKRPRTEASSKPAATAATGGAITTANLSKQLEAMEKAKRALQLQKQIQEKLKKLPQVSTAAAAAAAPGSATASAVNPAMVAAATQRAVAAAARFGVQASAANVPAAAAAAVRPVASMQLDVNQRLPPPPAQQQQQQQLQPAVAPSGPDPSMFHDPGLGDVGLAKLERRRRGFDFVQEGTFQKQAEIMRLKQKYGESAFKRQQFPLGPVGPTQDPNKIPLGGGDVNKIPLGGDDANLTPLGPKLSEEDQLRSQLLEFRDPIPDVEWWDRLLLVGGKYHSTPSNGGSTKTLDDEHVDGGAGDGDDVGVSKDHAAAEQDDMDTGEPNVQIRENKITHYVEHPIPLEPPAEAPPPLPQPLKLTKRELKKLRTQRRQTREKEKQELIRQGLLEPPKPKVKITNLPRVMGVEAAADPTAIEAEVRKQMAERQSAHDDRNLARMLTPAEKREKKVQKLFDESGLETITAVYKIADLSYGQHKFKVEVNAKENHMSGAMLLTDDFALVIVEGCRKSIKRYHKLLLRRIDWNARGDDLAVTAPGADEDDEGADVADKPPNSCYLVWEGIVKDGAFKEFTKHDVSSAGAARRLLEERGVAHYWDAAVNFDPDAAVMPEL